MTEHTLEPMTRAFHAAGYTAVPVAKADPSHWAEDLFREAAIELDGELTDEEGFRKRIVESIKNRCPIIAFGVIGPPEACVITGYEDEGELLIGWSFFQDEVIGQPGVEFLPDGYFRKRNWEADTWSMMAIGDKLGTPDRRAAYIDALKWALHVMREPTRYKGERHNGIAAYDAWAEHVLRDDEVAGGTTDRNDPFGAHSDAVDVVAEGRHYGSVFLRQVAEVLSEAKNDLMLAAEACKAQHDLMWEIWKLVGGNRRGAEQRTAFLKPEVRQAIVPLILKARDRQAAADFVEEALAALSKALRTEREKRNQ